VTLRGIKRLPSLRKQIVFSEMRRALAHASRAWFRLLHFSVQPDHVHLLVEAHDEVALSRGMAGLTIRLARSINRQLGRRGRVWADRYHARSLPTPREVRHAIVYVLNNWMKHLPHAAGLDRCSSAFWFDGWKLPPSFGPPGWEGEAAPVVTPRTWLAKTGWRRFGLVSRHEHPKSR
jgi:REP element-mobilizing transposase RayT